MRVSALYIHPIKGCRGTSLDSSKVDRYGLVGDRRLMLVDETGRFLSQRGEPRLATITPELVGTTLRLSSDGAESLELELDPTGPSMEVSIWASELTAVDQGAQASGWFSDLLDREIHLVMFGAPSQRPIDPEFSPRPDAETAFTDGYPLLVVTEESLANLNSRLEEPVPMSRFRPNVVVTGAEAWSEDAWKGFSIGQMEFDAVKPCARCVVPTTDQASGARHANQEPLRTLAGFRTLRPFGAIFGQNVVPRSTGRIEVGDEVVVNGTGLNR